MSYISGGGSNKVRLNFINRARSDLESMGVKFISKLDVVGTLPIA